ncbi:VOC family protein [Halobacillus yeomjeoni]|uniref:VOC family protein n=1 Tax=Halobacillus yeomjeoni TaxID=311194 RepID=UPI001CD77E23|nr:VOC family protein [Halobacillus yeomjeoni]MCA0983241.1 VOC family protein [Halobacillus yeomjeoni]
MNHYLKRVGAAYIPVSNVVSSSNWYQEKLGAIENYQDEEKAILEFANQSFFLVKSQGGENNQFTDQHGNEHFSLTFEVDGLDSLIELHNYLKQNEVDLKDIEDRGHPGRNFVFYDLDSNAFDVWSELSPDFKKRYSSLSK